MTSFFDKSTNEGQTVTEDMQAVSIQSKEHTQNAMAKCRNGFICFLSFLLYGGVEALTPTIYNTVAAVLQRTFCIFGKIVVYAKKHTCFLAVMPGERSLCRDKCRKRERRDRSRAAL